MVGFKKVFNFFCTFCLLICNYSWAQTTDLEFDEVRVNTNLAPLADFCQGEIPTFELRFRLEAGSTTLTLTTTNTLEITALVSGANVFTRTITGVISTDDGGNQILTSGSEFYTWPVVGANAIQLSNPGATSVIFRISLNSSRYSDPDDPDSAVSETIPINVKAQPPQVSLSTSNGAFDGGRNISICSGNDLIIYADTGYTHYEFFYLHMKD